MQIEKILNNNVVTAINEDNEEIILMGRGLGFKKKNGDLLDSEKIEKVYELKNQKETERIEEMFSEISVEVIEISDEILTIAKADLEKNLSGTVFVAIADHLHGAIERQKQGVQMKNFLLWDIKRFFPKEFLVGKKAITLIEEKLGVSLSEDEAGFLTLHIVNAEMDSSNEGAIELTRLIDDILKVVKYTLQMTFDEETIYFQRFMTHLKFFSERVIQNKPEKKEENVDDDLYLMIKRKYPQAFEVTKKLSEFLEQQWHYNIIHDEQIYLTIHLARIIEKSEKMSD